MAERLHEPKIIRMSLNAARSFGPQVKEISKTLKGAAASREVENADTSGAAPLKADLRCKVRSEWLRARDGKGNVPDLRFCQSIQGIDHALVSGLALRLDGHQNLVRLLIGR